MNQISLFNLRAASVAAALALVLTVAAPARSWAQSQQQVFPSGPVVTLQLANINELCGAYNLGSFNSNRDYIGALNLNIRLHPGDDKRDLVLQCALDMELAAQQGRLPDSLARLALGWVLMSCLTLADLGLGAVDTRTCAEVRAVRDRNTLVR